MAKWAGPDIMCIVTGQWGADIHHLYTQKSHPEFKEKEWNQLKLCHALHVEAHQKGLTYMSTHYGAIMHWLLKHGWEYDDSRRKWLHPAAITETQ